MAAMNTSSSFAGLTPSQALRSSESQRNDDAPINSGEDVTDGGKKRGKPRRRRRNRKNEPKIDNATPNGSAAEDATKEDESPNSKKPAQKSKKVRGKKGRNRGKKKYPWRRFIPSGSVDPITLEDLISLPYPPFALVAGEPYEPVPVWPVPEENTSKKEEDIEKIHRKRIEEQWGESMVTPNQDSQPKEESSGKKYYNLYDGRALAYYMTSQLQFIDPLNRRDLTREELLNLDDYLQRHGFKDLRVVEAYDAKGITISTAGSAAHTAQGRAEILQQMASNLLTSLFGGHAVQAPSQPTSTLSLQDQYAADRQREENFPRPQQQSRGLNPNAISFEGSGIYNPDGGGFTIIDDDENPGLRGGRYSAASVRSHSPRAGNHIHPFYAAGHIATRYGNGNLSGSTNAFPALPTSSAPTAIPPAASIPNGGATKPSKTLSRITRTVKKTNPEESQRQWEAREQARKRAMLANLSFGVDTSAIGAMQGLPKPSPGLSASTAKLVVSDDKLQRNKAFAEALGVKPATLRQQLNSGWARPIDAKISLDEFGNELNAAIYSEALVAEARERMGFLLKLEKKWKLFLTDDTAASLPLNHMDRQARKFVHEYSDFWNLRTESFDPEPKRYIHCVKMLDTHMPHPLLSDAATNWRGPLPSAKRQDLDHTSQQTAGQSTRSREIPPPSDRMPLPLMPRSLPQGQQKQESNPPSSEEGAQVGNSRFGSLLSNRERPKLELIKRTVPLELPPFQPAKAYSIADDMQQRQIRLEEKARKERQAAEQKRKALEDAFASDDEDDGRSSESEWEEAKPLYTASDDET